MRILINSCKGKKVILVNENVFYLCLEDVVEQHLCLLLLFCDVSIRVHSKHFWRLVDRQVFNVLQIVLKLK